MRLDFPKPPLSHQDQLSLLSQRGLAITNHIEAIETLKTINYYRLKGYYLHLYDESNQRFLPGTTLHKVKMIHDFDCSLLHLTADILMKIEIAFKAQVAYCHANEYGGLGYTHPENFKDQHKHRIFLEICKKSVAESHDKFCEHLCSKYNCLPIWAVVELLSMSSISKLYSNMLDDDAKYIAKEYYGLSNFLPIKANMYCLSVLRNICAHGGRIYGRRLPFRINLYKADHKYFTGEQNNTYFSALFAMKRLSPTESIWRQFIVSLWDLINRYNEYIDTAMLGLRDPWFDILLERAGPPH